RRGARRARPDRARRPRGPRAGRGRPARGHSPPGCLAPARPRDARAGSSDEGGDRPDQRVGDPPSVKDHEVGGQRVRPEPLDGEALPRRRLRRPARHPTVEAEVDVVPHPPVGIADDLEARIRIDADQAAYGPLVPRLLATLADDGVRHRLADLDRAPGQAPFSAVRPLLEEQAPLVEDGRRHARPDGLRLRPIALDLHGSPRYPSEVGARNVSGGAPGRRGPLVILRGSALDSGSMAGEGRGVTAVRADVCVAGGGPAGQLLGLLLAKRGARVLVLEGHETFDRDFRGEVLQPSTAHLLGALGLLDYIRAQPHSTLTAGVVRLNGRRAGEFAFARIAPEYPYAIWMPQPVFLQALVDRARAFPS